MARDFFDSYFSYVGDTEAPMIFHRWSIMECVASALGRRCYVPLGHFKIYPSMYVMLIGSSGTRKSTSISLAKGLMKQAGYRHFAADKTSKEKFIMDLMEKNHTVEGITQLNDMKIEDTAIHDAEMFIVSDEFQDFMGQNNLEFITTLGKLWDVKDDYTHKIKTGKSSVVHNPVVNILGGNTPTGFSLTFPPEIVGQGFLSRLLLIYGDSTAKKIAWPKPVDEVLGKQVVDKLKAIMATPSCKFGISRPARDIIGKIYNSHITINDPRFSSYETRRHDHLLKLCALTCAMRSGTELNTDDVLAANTMLYYAERRMPLALGEFGKGKFSEVSNAVVEALNRSAVPMDIHALWKIVAADLSKMQELAEIIKGLMNLDKIQQTNFNGAVGFLPKRNTVDYFDNELLLDGFLTEEEEIAGGKNDELETDTDADSAGADVNSG